MLKVTERDPVRDRRKNKMFRHRRSGHKGFLSDGFQTPQRCDPRLFSLRDLFFLVNPSDFLNGSNQDLTREGSEWGQWNKGSAGIYLRPLASAGILSLKPNLKHSEKRLTGERANCSGVQWRNA